MVKKLFLVSTYRRIFLVITAFLLIAISSYIFVDKSINYFLSKEEIQEASKFYRAIGEIVWDGDETPDIIEISQYIDNLEMVKTVNYYASLSGILDNDINNVEYQMTMPSEMDYMGYASANDIIIVGTYKGFENERKDTVYFFRVNDVISGYAEYVVPQKEIAFFNDDRGLFGKSLTEGEKYVIRGHYSTVTDFGTAKRLLENRQDVEFTDFSIFELKSLTKDGQLFAEYGSWNSDEIADDLFLMEENRKAISINAYADISAASFLQGDKHTFYLEEGYWPNADDDTNQCVISKKLAESRGISLGDSIGLTLRDIEDEFGQGFCNVQTIAEYEDILKEHVDLKVVGIFSENAEIALWQNTVFAFIDIVPKTFRSKPQLPIYQYYKSTAVSDGKNIDIISSDTHVSKMAGTFVLKANEDKEPFIEETKDYFAAKGISTSFYENGYAHFKEVSANMLADEKRNLILYGAILIVLYILSVELYGISLRKEVGLLRVLGVEKTKCITGFLIPISSIGLLSILSGSAISVIRLVGNDISADKSLYFLLARLELGLNFFFILIISIYSLFIVNLPIMNILKKPLLRKRTSDEPLKSKKTIKSSKYGALCRLAFNIHIRSKDGWIWTATVVCLFIICNSMLSTIITNQNNKLSDLYESINIHSDIVKIDNYYLNNGDDRGYIDKSVIDKIENSDFFENIYLASELNVMDIYEIDDSTGLIYGDYNNHLVMKTHAEAATNLAFLLSNDGVSDINWNSGWSLDHFEESVEDEYPILVPDYYYTGLWNTNPRETAVYYSNGEEKKICQFTIAGTYKGGKGYLYVPLEVLENLLGDYVSYYEASFDVKNEYNVLLDEVKATVDEIMKEQESAKTIFWDQEFSSSVNRIRSVINILEKLRLIMKYASILIIGLLALLVANQRKKDGILTIAMGNSIGMGRIVVLVQLSLTAVIGSVTGVFFFPDY